VKKTSQLGAQLRTVPKSERFCFFPTTLDKVRRSLLRAQKSLGRSHESVITDREDTPCDTPVRDDGSYCKGFCYSTTASSMRREEQDVSLESENYRCKVAKKRGIYVVKKTSRSTQTEQKGGKR